MIEYKAVIATVVDEGDRYVLVVGEGDQECDRWELTPSLVAKLAYEVTHIAFKKYN